MSKGTLEIHSQNILPIIKKWLYTDKDIFIRELVSNSCDAISKRLQLASQAEVDPVEDTPVVRIKIDKEKSTLTITDEGIGMDSEEVVRYLSQVAFSSAEEFIEKYQSEDKPIIGHFGLGFYSAFMVASKVVVKTLRASTDKNRKEAVIWSCDGSTEYELESCDKQSIGTEITLYIAQEHSEYLEKEKVESTLRKYARFLPYPVFFEEKRVNEVEPIWEKKPSELEDKDYIDFYRHLYPGKPDPMFWIHLNVDYPFSLQGVLYFPSSQGQWQDKNSEISLFCQRVFVSEHCRDILPDYLSALHGALDSADIPLNVSRSSLQRDATVTQLSGHISKKVADKLKSIFQKDRAQYEKVWPSIEGIIKYGIHEDSKFLQRMQEALIWKTVSGEFKTVEEITGASEGERNVYYLVPDQVSAQITKLYPEDKTVLAHPVMDPPTMSLLEREGKDLHFLRLDGKLGEELLDKSREDTLLNADGKTKATLLQELASKAFTEDNAPKVEVKSLKEDHLPALVIIEETQRRMRDWFARQNEGSQDLLASLPSGQTLVLNSNNPTIQAIDKLKESNTDLAKDLLKEVYALALLSQGELGEKEKQSFVQRSFALIQKLAST